MSLRDILQQSAEQKKTFTSEDLEKIQKIKKILYRINTDFHNAEPTIGTLEKISDTYDFRWFKDKNSTRLIDRREYIEAHPEIQDRLNFSFSLSADDIIAQKIPKKVMGCTGIAKLFAKYAEEEQLDCFAVYTAKIQNLEDKKHGKRDIVNGHQIIAVQFSDGVHMFDPGLQNGLQFYKDNSGQEIVVDVPRMLLGKELVSQRGDDPWAERQAGTVITCVEPAQKLEHIKSYKDLEKRYLVNESIQGLHEKQNE